MPPSCPTPPTLTGGNRTWPWSALDAVDQPPRAGQQARGEQDPEGVADQEVLHAQVVRRPRVDADRVGEPGGTEGVDHDVAEDHRRQRADRVAVPAAVGEPADER